MHRTHLLVVLVWLLICQVVRAETVRVARRHGPALIGEAARHGEVYEVFTEAGLIRIPANEVLSVQAYVPFEREYARRVGELPADDAAARNAARYRLAVWARAQGRADKAVEQLRLILSEQPGNENARLLLGLAEREAAEGRGPAAAEALATALDKLDLLSDADIQVIRRSELRGDDKVKIVFRNRVLSRFIEAVRASGEYRPEDVSRFYRDLDSVQKAIEILDALPQRADLHRDILVLSNPSVINAFKTRVWPVLQRGCASAACHGGPSGAGRLKLINAPLAADELVYTNFLLLSDCRTLAGRMIDRAHPERSLLLRYGLPGQNDAASGHPGGDVALFKGPDDSDYQAVQRWIGTLITPWQGYTVDYALPDWGRGNADNGNGGGGAILPPATPAAPAAKP